ncbi:ubiquitin carboxyl-terminal hydrolase 8 isoform X2 [Ricinus communis]|uniref:ubiquitin carboxyl-terminal hydrolase 8 isoform X2 n=1 Tax=Ricinus communis TaxID=3988 RepID=UPI00201A4AC2|nr:ubiquitin carboxyl-terminal hydrolase 8 isoform X2 [Ricinus communis]
MSRLLSKKLFVFSLIAKSTIKLTQLSLSTFHLFKSLTLSLFSKTLTSMDDDFFSSAAADDSNYLDFDTTPSTSYSSRRYFGRPFIDDDDSDVEKLYLVPFRWWKEAKIGGDGQIGVLYDVAVSGGDVDKEIALDLRKVEEDSRKSDDIVYEEYALLSGTMWLQALKWHNDSKAAVQDVDSPLLAEDDLEDVFPLQIRLSVSPETNSLIVKISLKENEVAFYRRACNIFFSKNELHIWDFSRQTTQVFMKVKIDLPNCSMGQSAEEVLVELEVYGFPDSIKVRDRKIDEMAENSVTDGSFSTGLVKMNGSSDLMSFCSTPTNSSLSGCSYRRFGYLGLAGLRNLGNTCFMNSAIQCLAHTAKLVDYFIGDYERDINRENPLGLKGELALAFGNLLRKLWAPGAILVAPRMFKLKLANFAPQFSGYNQHDSQEFLAFLLDGLHEDLNRVKCKPYTEAKDTDDHPDNEVADDYWQNHLARNDSIIVDLCQGQYRSTLVCPMCKKKSVTFDPFMYLSLPLPSTTMRTMTLTLLSTDGSTLPSPITVTVPKCGRLKDLLDALSSECPLRNDETLLVAEIYRNKIFRFLEEPSDSLALIRDDDKLVAYRLPKDNEASLLVVFLHELLDKPSGLESAAPNWKLFGIPLVARFSDLCNGSKLRKQYLKVLNPFLMPADDDILNDYDDLGITANDDSAMADIPSPTVSENNAGSDGETDDDSLFSSEFQINMTNLGESAEIQMSKPSPIPKFNKRFEVYVSWSKKMIEKYDTCILSSLPEVFKPQLYTRRPQESVSLYKCLEAFLKEEPLGPEDMWFCPACKKHRQASKKLDLWRLPEILVVHLKRFSYSRVIKNKLETHVDFPVEDFDLSTYISRKDGQFSYRYELYAISNHYGGMGGGHYTAFVDHGHGRWYEFDDDNVSPVNEGRIITSAAYVLFYRRIA